MTMRMDWVRGFRSREIGRWSRKHLAADAHVRSDGLACFAAVKQAGCTHEPLVTSGPKGRQRRKAFVWIDTYLGNVKNALHGTYHAIRAKRIWFTDAERTLLARKVEAVGRWLVRHTGIFVASLVLVGLVASSAQGQSAEALGLLSLGNAAYQRGKLGEAARLYERLWALLVRELGEDHPAKLTAMANLAATYRDLSEFGKALGLFEQTLKSMYAMLGADHPGTLRVMTDLALTYSDVGAHEKALALQEQVLGLQRAKLGEDHPDTLNSMNYVAITYRRLGRLDEALALREQTVKVWRAKLGEDHPNTLASMNNLAVLYGVLSQSDKALALLEQTLKLRRAKLGEDHPHTLESMSNLALVYRDLGQPDKAFALQEQALKLRRAKLGENHPETLKSWGNLALNYLDLGEPVKALAVQEYVLKLLSAKLGEDHPDTLVSMGNLAVARRTLGQYDLARGLVERTLNLRRAKLGEDHPDTLASMGNLAVAYTDLGQPDKALALQEHVLKLLSAKLGEDHPDTLASMNNLANTYSNLGRHEQARALNEQVLKLRRAKLGEDHPRTLDSMNNLAVAYSELGRHDQTLALIPRIVSGIEKLRTLPGLSVEQRRSIFAEYSDRYQRYATLYARADLAVQGFEVGDLSKARTLADSIRTGIALRALPEAEQQRLHTSEARGRALQQQLGRQVAPGSRDTDALLRLQEEWDRHGAAHRALLVELGRRHPKYAQLSNLPLATADQAGQLLGADEAFVSYLIGSDGSAQAFVLDRAGRARWVGLGRIGNHAKTVAAYRQLATSFAPESQARGRLVPLEGGGYEWREGGELLAVKGPLDTLERYWHDTLIKPVLPLAAGFKRWIISPDKDLALLPFDLLAESFDPEGQIRQRLVHTRDLTVVQSFAVLALLKQRERDYAALTRPRTLFAMGNAVYAEGWAQGRGAGGQRYELRDAARFEPARLPAGLPPAAEQRAMNEIRWSNLPGTAKEVTQIAALYGPQADSYLGTQASEARLMQLSEAGRLKDYRYLLFSAHGYLARNPALSSLVLSRQGNPPGIDGYVTASEWMLYDLRSDLTVLSACDTGVGRTLAGESVMGLPYALFVAGNRNTMLTLWPVDDEATAEFTLRFFIKLNSGLAQADALRQVKLEFIRDARWRHPAYWAAFVLYGV